MSDHQVSNRPPFIARAVHLLAVPIIIVWVALAAITFFAVPYRRSPKMRRPSRR